MNCQFANMADAAKARREARRRKILENSHNRLQLISGKNGNELCRESPIEAPISKTNYENSVILESSIPNRCYINNGVVNTELDPFGSLSTSHEHFAIGDGDVTAPNYDLPVLNTSPTPDPPPTPLFQKLANCKYDIVVLSLLIQLLHSMSLVTESTYLFLPLLLYVVTKQMFYPKQESSNIANALLLLNGISASRVQKIMSITQWMRGFSQDVCVFLFTTICMQSLWQMLWDSSL